MTTTPASDEFAELRAVLEAPGVWVMVAPDKARVLAVLDALVAEKARLAAELADAKAALTRWGDQGAFQSLRAANDRMEKAEADKARLLAALDRVIGKAAPPRPKPPSPPSERPPGALGGARRSRRRRRW